MNEQETSTGTDSQAGGQAAAPRDRGARLYAAAEGDEWTALRRVGVFLEKANLADWVDLMNDPRRHFWVNFWAGVARGMGMIVGAFLVGALFALFSAHLLHKAFMHAGGIPWVGGEMREAIGFILKVVRDTKRGG